MAQQIYVIIKRYDYSGLLGRKEAVMQLLRLELKGFKSFADKTVVKFSPGMTAVIGPNGSGKSNITDAMKWVLGIQCP